MFEISELKDKSLSELQEIAKTVGAKKFSQLKKLDLVYLILDIQAAAPPAITNNEALSDDDKPRRKRIVKKANQPKTNPPKNANTTVVVLIGKEPLAEARNFKN